MNVVAAARTPLALSFRLLTLVGALGTGYTLGRLHELREREQDLRATHAALTTLEERLADLDRQIDANIEALARAEVACGQAVSP